MNAYRNHWKLDFQFTKHLHFSLWRKFYISKKILVFKDLYILRCQENKLPCQRICYIYRICRYCLHTRTSLRTPFFFKDTFLLHGHPSSSTTPFFSRRPFFFEDTFLRRGHLSSSRTLFFFKDTLKDTILLRGHPSSSRTPSRTPFFFKDTLLLQGHHSSSRTRIFFEDTHLLQGHLSSSRTPFFFKDINSFT